MTIRGARLAVAVVLVGAVLGCSGSRSPAPSAVPSPTYQLPARTVRPFETPLAQASAVSGALSFTVMGLRAHLPSLVGTHAEFLAHGEFVRLRVAVDNSQATYATVNTADLVLRTADGGSYRPEYNAMHIARQPDTFSLGAQDRIELDLWYDLPRGQAIRALQVRAPNSPTRQIPLPAG